MTWLLLPGRHHLLTRYQRDELTRLLSTEAPDRPIAGLIWAVTSANHSHTRRNPLPAHRREAAIEQFSREFAPPSLVYLIDDLGESPRFADYIVKKIAVESRGRLALSPENTLVATGTPELADLFTAAGFRVHGMEMTSRQPLAFAAASAWRLLEDVCERHPDGRGWESDEAFVDQVAPASLGVLLKYDYPTLIADLRRHPFLNEDGDLTATRDYNVYARAFDEGAARKYALVKDLVRPGRIVDVGCGAGAVLREMAADDRLRESDLHGIEAARPLFAECVHRKHQGAFANDNVFFHQSDFAAGPLFPEASIHTFTTFSLTHEIESYQGRAALVRFIELIHRQLAPGGRWINLDVVGPDDPRRIVHLRLATHDGAQAGAQTGAQTGAADRDDPDRVFAEDDREGHRRYLAGLSTLGKFQRFARDFRAAEGHCLRYDLSIRPDGTFAVLSLGDACEFLSKKDYLDNWRSEMHETFCFWSFRDWRAALEEAGYKVHGASRAFTNPWLVENRYRGKADLFIEAGEGLAPLEYPPTNVLLAADKP